MSYWEMLKRGNFSDEPAPAPQHTRKMTAYDKFKQKKRLKSITAEPKPNVEVFRPKSLNEVENLIDKMKGQEGIIVDLNKVGLQQAQRMLDFLSGAVYALNGTVKHLKDRIYVFSPQGIYLG